MANATATELQQLYIAYFGRAADPSGLTYWTDEGTTTKAFAANMYAQNEFKSVYGSLNVEAQVNQIYQNLFDRDADATGLLYWTQQINNGTLELASIANDLIWAANNNSGSSDDKTALTNKTNAAVAYTAKVEETTAGILAYAPASSSPWVAGANIEAAVTYFQGIDKDTPHTTSGIASSVSTIVSNGVQDGKYTLTSDSPTITEGDTGTKTLSFTITLDRDASAATTVNYETLTTGTATAGDDFVSTAGTVSFAKGQKTATVDVTINGDTTYENSGTAETVKVKFSGSDLVADVEGSGSITENDTDPSTVTQTLSLTTGVNDLTGGSAADVFDATVSNTLNTGDTLAGGAGTDTLNAKFGSAHTATVSSTGIETFSLEAVGDTTLNLADVSGLTSIYNQGSTAALTLNNITTIPTIYINTNEKASTFNFTNSAMSSTTDDLEIRLDGVKDSDDGTDGLSSITLTSASGATNTIETVSLVTNSVLNKLETLSTTGVGATKLEITGDQGLTIRDKLNTEVVTIDASSATGALGLTAADATAVSITLNSSSTTGSTVTTHSGADTITGVAGGDTIDAAAGANSITATSGANSITTTTGKDTIVGGSGNDTITSGDEIDSITGGAGNDSITSGAGADIVDAGAGADVIIDTDGAAVNNNLDGGAGNDTITVVGTELTTDDTVKGGADTDTLIIDGDVTNLADADFTNVTGIEVLENKDVNEQLDVTLGTEAAEAGITTININSVDQDELITFDAKFTNDLTINLNSTASAGGTVDDHDAIDITGTGYTGVLTVNIKGQDLAAAQSITSGSGTSDVLLFSSTANTAHAHTVGVTGFETIKASAGASASWQVANESTADGANIHLDGSALTSDYVFTADAGDEADAIVSITGGAGNDVITIGESDLGQVVNAGAGDDNIKVTTLDKLTTADTIDGGSGANTLTLLEQDKALGDSDFTNITNVQTLTAATGIAFGKDDETLKVTLGTEAAEAGITTITYATDDENSNVILNAGFTNTVTVNITDDEDNLDASAYTGTLTVNSAALAVAASNAITGGTGTNDTLLYTGTGLGGTISGITAIEKFKVNSDANATLVLANANVIAGQTLTIDATSITTATNTFTADLTLEATATASIVVQGSAGVDTITISQVNDSIDTGAADDVVTMTGAYFTTDDTVDGGAGDDKIVAGADFTVSSGMFTNVSNFEILEGTSNGTNDFIITGTLGADAASAGLTTINFLHNDESGDAITLASGYASDVTVDFDGAHENVFDASAISNAVTINATLLEMNTGVNLDHTIKGGSGTGDKLNLSVTSAETVAAADTAAIEGVETWTLTDGEANTARSFSIALSDVNASWTDANNYDVLTIDASALVGDTAAIDATNETDAQVKIFGGAAGDTLTADLSTNVGSSITGGAGNDTIVFDDEHLTSNDTVDGGAGTADVIKFTDDTAATVDADFTNVTNVEQITTAGDFTSLTLGSEAAGAGINYIDLTGDDAAAGITLGSGFTNDVTVVIAANNADVINASSATGKMTVTAVAAHINGSDNIDAGSNTADTLSITADADSTGMITTALSGFEQITLVADGSKSALITMGGNDTQIATGKTLTVDLTAGGAASHFVGTASETDGSLVITGSGTASSLTGGGGVDTITGGAGADTINGGAGADSLTGGAAADRMIGGAGADTLVGGDGTDTFVLSTVSNDGSNSLTDFVSADDILEITADYSGLANAIEINAARVASTGSAGVSAFEANLTGKRLEYGYDTTNSKLIIETGSNQAISGADWQLSINAADTAGSTISAAEINFNITGTDSADTITLDAGAHTLESGGGNDTITAGSGIMTIDSDTGNDTITLTNEATNVIQTIIIDEGDATAVTTAVNAKATAVNTDVVGFSGGITTVANFEAGANKDILSLTNVDLSASGAAATVLGAADYDGIADNGGYVIYGTAAATSFTFGESFNATNQHDALVFVANGADHTGINSSTEMIVLLDLDAALDSTNVV